MPVNVTVKVDDAAFKDALQRVQQRGQNLSPVFAAIAARLLASSQQRFETKKGPDGKAWEPLAASTIASKAAAGQAGGGILKVEGYLLRSLDATSTGDYAMVGTNLVYARIHQLGGKTKAHTIKPVNKKALAFGGVVRKYVNHPGSNIPARPFLGVSEADESAINGIITNYLQGALA